MTELTSSVRPVRALLPRRLAASVLIGAGAAALAFPLVLLATGRLILGLGAAVAIGLLPLAVNEPFVALAIFAGLEVSQSSGALERLGVPSPLVVSQLVALISLALATLRHQTKMAWSPVLLGALILLASRALTVLTSVDPSTSLTNVVDMAKDMLTLVFTVALLLTTRRTSGLMRAAVASLAVLSLISAVQEFGLHNNSDLSGFALLGAADVGSTTLRHSGPIGDPNFWGRVLVMFLPFSAALALSANRWRSRLTWIAATGSILLGVFLSQSRGGFLSVGVAIAIFLLLAGWQYARWLAIAPVVLAILLLLPATGPRLQTLSQLSESSSGGGDASLVLRLASQQAGAEMLRQHPILGVGAGNYEREEALLTRTLSFATTEEISGVVAPHNAYLEYAAEGGYLGGGALLTFLGTITFAAGRAWLAASRKVPPGRLNQERLLAAACLASVAGWAIASAVLHVRQFRTLLVVAAIAAVLDVTRDRNVSPAPFVWSTRKDLAPWGVFLVAVAIGSLLVAASRALVSERWRVDSTVAVRARVAAGGGLDAYHFDVLSRDRIVPTFAVAATTPSILTGSLSGLGLDPSTWRSYKLTVTTRPRSAAFAINVEGRNREQTVAVAQSVLRFASKAISAENATFVLDAGMAGPVVTQTSTFNSRVATPAVELAAVVALALAWRQLNRRHDRRLATWFGSPASTV